MTKPHVLLIGGGHAQPSHSSALLRAVERCLYVRGASTCRWDVAAKQLPPPRPGVDAYETDREVRGFVAAARTAVALAIVTPVYNDSYTGAIKDALDHLSPRELRGKPVALLSNCGSMPSTQALDHLRDVVRSLRAVAIPRQVVTVDSDYELTGDRYALASVAIGTRLMELADELLWVTRKLQARAEPALSGGA
jgi:NAD(P)H-dependent FMN reductase